MSELRPLLPLVSPASSVSSVVAVDIIIIIILPTGRGGCSLEPRRRRAKEFVCHELLRMNNRRTNYRKQKGRLHLFRYFCTWRTCSLFGFNGTAHPDGPRRFHSAVDPSFQYLAFNWIRCCCCSSSFLPVVICRVMEN